MPQGIRIGIVNQGDAATLAVRAEDLPDMVATNLQDSQLTKVWRVTPTTDGVLTGIFSSAHAIEIVPGSSFSVDTIALLGHASVEQTAKFRVRWSETLDLFVAVYPLPATLVSSANLSGAIGAVDDPVAFVDGSWLTAVSHTVDTTAHVRFNPSGTAGGTVDLLAGAGLQRFSVWVRKSASGGTNPTYTMKVYDNGVDKGTIATGSITSLTGQTLTGTWNASVLASLSSTTIECVVGVAAGTTSTGEFGAFEARLEHDPAHYDYDHTTDPAPAGPDGAVIQLVDLPPSIAVQAVDTILIEQAFFDSTNPVSIGRLYVGGAFIPTRTVDVGWSMAIEDSTTIESSVGGQEHFDVGYQRRILTVTLSYLTETEAYDRIFYELDRLKGLAGDLVVILQPDTTTQWHNQVMYCRLVRLDPVVHQGWADGQHRYRRTLVFRELL